MIASDATNLMILSMARAAEFARKHRSLVDLNDEQFDLLLRACSGHTFAMPHGKAGSNTTLAACWDADRLDIDRGYRH